MSENGSSRDVKKPALDNFQSGSYWKSNYPETYYSPDNKPLLQDCQIYKRYSNSLSSSPQINESEPTRLVRSLQASPRIKLPFLPLQKLISHSSENVPYSNTLPSSSKLSSHSISLREDSSSLSSLPMTSSSGTSNSYFSAHSPLSLPPTTSSDDETFKNPFVIFNTNDMNYLIDQSSSTFCNDKIYETKKKPNIDMIELKAHLISDEAELTKPEEHITSAPISTLLKLPIIDYSLDANISFFSNGSGLLQSKESTDDNLYFFLLENQVIFSILTDLNSNFWLDLYNPSSSDLLLLSFLFGLHPLSIEDIETQDPFEKCESFEYYLFYIIQLYDSDISLSSKRWTSSKNYLSSSDAIEKSVHIDIANRSREIQQHDVESKSRISLSGSTKEKSSTEKSSNMKKEKNGTSESSIFLDHNGFWYEKQFIYLIHFPTGVVSIHYKQIKFIEPILEQLSRASIMEQPYLFDAKLNIHGHWTPDLLIYLLLDRLIQETAPLFGLLETETEALETLLPFLNTDDKDEILPRISRASRKLDYLEKLVRPKLDIINQLSDRYSSNNNQNQLDEEAIIDKLKIGTIALFNFNLLKDHVSFLLKRCQSISESLQYCYTSYSGKVSIDLSQSSIKTDALMKNLSGIACLLLPISLIIDVYSMNIPLPGTKSFTIGSLWILVVVLAVMASCSLVTYIVIKRFKYI